MKWSDREAVLSLCERLAPLHIAYLEEPLPSDDLEGYAWLTSRTPSVLCLSVSLSLCLSVSAFLFLCLSVSH